MTTPCCASPTTPPAARRWPRRSATWPGSREQRSRRRPTTSRQGSTLWHGRFEGGPAAELMAYTESLSFDQRLWPDDIEGSRAHVRGLCRSQIITDLERDQVLAALDTAAAELAAGTFVFVASDEDIHTAVERRVTELAGRRGRQAAHRPQPQRPERHRRAAVVQARAGAWSRAGSSTCRRCSSNVPRQPATCICPATPTCSAPNRCCSPITCWRTAGRSPATSSASSTRSNGSTCRRWARVRSPARRCRSTPMRTAADLGFARRFENSLDAVGSRDHIAEALFALTMVGIDLSRIGEELVLWTTDEFGFAVLDDGYATGSSMLPQKKNPDIAELARGKAGRLIGDLTGFLATMKGLPLSYNRDYQEDKEPLFDAVDQISLALGAMTGHDRHHAAFVTERMQAAADAETSVGHRSGRVARAARHAVPRGARSGRPAGADGAGRARRRCATWWPPTTHSVPMRRRWSLPVSRCGGGSRRAAPARSRWPISWCGFAPASTSSARRSDTAGCRCRDVERASRAVRAVAPARARPAPSFDVVRPRRHRGGARPRGCRAPLRRARCRDHRGRGVHRRRPGQPLVAWMHPAQRGRCSVRPDSGTSTWCTACTTA